MSSETKKTSENKIGCTEWGQMSGMYTDMMKMMEKCCPGMKEKFSNEESMKVMMGNCCGIMEARSGMPTGSQNKSEQKTDRKDSNKCCC